MEMPLSLLLFQTKGIISFYLPSHTFLFLFKDMTDFLSIWHHKPDSNHIIKMKEEPSGQRFPIRDIHYPLTGYMGDQNTATQLGSIPEI